MVRHGSAKPLFIGSIPIATSINKKSARKGRFFYLSGYIFNVPLLTFSAVLYGPGAIVQNLPLTSTRLHFLNR